jgi:hypothetical protein
VKSNKLTAGCNDAVDSYPTQEQPTTDASQKNDCNEKIGSAPTALANENGRDFMRIPFELESSIEHFDYPLRPTLLEVGSNWTKNSYSLFSSDAPPKETLLSIPQLESERNNAFTLLDFLSRSGSLVLELCSLHVIIPFTHCFDSSVLNCVLQDSLNPLELLERSNLLLASHIYESISEELLR